MSPEQLMDEIAYAIEETNKRGSGRLHISRFTPSCRKGIAYLGIEAEDGTVALLELQVVRP